MHVVYERCAAIDVGKDEIAVAVRMPGDGPEGRVTVKRTFRTFLRGDGRGRPVAGLARRHARGNGGDRGYLGFSGSTITFPQVGLSRTRPRRKGKSGNDEGQ
jgi:hypothetical protein